MLPVYLFDDGKCLAPMTDFRAAFDVRTGALTLVGRLAAAAELQVMGVFVPDALAAITRERHTVSVNPVLGRRESFVAINARCPFVRPVDLVRLSDPGIALVHEATREIIAACVTPDMLAALVADDTAPFRLEKVGDREFLRAFSRPWHIKTRRDALIKFDLSLLMTSKALGVTPASPASPPNTHLAPTARVHPSAILDAESGPIYIADQAVVRHGAIISGPCYIGPHSTVMDRAIIRANTAVGPYCKVAGEISGTIFQGFSNKAHDGFLGDSWVGEWVNLGAGTTNSNLLNTYSEVIARATPQSPLERTGEQFLGAVIGDHVKTAISTRIMTGAVIHTGSMIATTAAAVGCIAPFSWCTDAGVRKYGLAKFVETARAMMGRRGVKPTEAYLRRLEGLHAAVPAAKEE
jgi:UDP-N-acetylglucosamine diphosphorylase/glucosamine-1-phosphate N-acetyltransferase